MSALASASSRDGSRTITTAPAPERSSTPVGTLSLRGSRLRNHRPPASAMRDPTSDSATSPSAGERDLEDGGEQGTSRHVRWRTDTVDNEFLGRKSSKICCIYHKPKGYDESSSESESDSSASSFDDASEPANGDGEATGAQNRNGETSRHRRRKSRRAHHCEHGDGHHHEHDQPPGDNDPCRHAQQRNRASEKKNMYERGEA